jgi:hypothetical protein
MTAEVVTIDIWDALTVRLDRAMGPPVVSSLIVVEVVAPITVVVSVSGTITRTGVPSPHSASVDGSWGATTLSTILGSANTRSTLDPEPVQRRRSARAQHAKQQKIPIKYSAN